MHGRRYSIVTCSCRVSGIEAEVEGWIGIPVDHTVQLTKWLGREYRSVVADIPRRLERSRDGDASVQSQSSIGMRSNFFRITCANAEQVRFASFI